MRFCTCICSFCPQADARNIFIPIIGCQCCHSVTARLCLKWCHCVHWRLYWYNTHTHTHLFNGPLSGTTRVSWYQKDKTNLDFTEARNSEWQWHQLGHMQVCTSLQTDNHASTPPLRYWYNDYNIQPVLLEHTSPSVLWHCWLGGRKGIRPVKNWAVGCWCGYLSGARCRLAYGPAVPLPLTVSCFSKIQIGFTFLVPAHSGSPGQRAIKRVCVCVTWTHRQMLSDNDNVSTLVWRGTGMHSTEYPLASICNSCTDY